MRTTAPTIQRCGIQRSPMTHLTRITGVPPVPACSESHGYHKHQLLIFLIILAAQANAADPPTSQWAHPGPDGKLIYRATPAGDRIMDFSYAGYMGGGISLPTVPVKQTVLPSGGDDDTKLIQAAINQVAKLPLENGFRGAVLLAPGLFTCPETITLPTSGIVLRGSASAGASTTTIKMTGKPHLAIAVRGPGGGGRQQGGNTRDATQTSIADAYVPSGALSFTVADAKGLAVGDTIVIRRPVTAAWVKFM